MKPYEFSLYLSSVNKSERDNETDANDDTITETARSAETN